MIFKSGIIVAFFTFLSRIFGLIRELFIAYLFGTTMIADSVNVAFRLPNLFRRLFAEGPMSAVFIPMFGQKLQESRLAARNFSSEILLIMIIATSLLTLTFEICMPYLMFFIAPGFHYNPEKFETTILLCRITMPYVILISIVALYSGVLNSLNKFAVASASPVIMNIIIVISTIFLGVFIKYEISISLSILIAGIIQLVVISYAAKKLDMSFSVSKKIFLIEDIKTFFSKLLPVIMSSGVTQISLFLSQAIASFIPGAISILSYAERLYQFPLSIIGITFSTILLPTLSKLYKLEDQLDQAKDLTSQSINIGLFLSIPAAIGIIALSVPIVEVIYQRGAFSAEDTRNTAIVLALFCLGLPAFILIKIITSAFFAAQNTSIPLKVTFISLVVNIFLNILFIQFISYNGIALGSVLASWYNLYLLMQKAKKLNIISLQILRKNFLRDIFLCSFFMLAAIMLSSYYIGDYFYSSALITRVFLLGVIICIGLFTYLLIAVIIKILPISLQEAIYPKGK